MGFKTYQEKNAKPMEKELAQSDIPEWREKSKKPSENAIFLKFGISGWFFGFFSSLVCPIELILFALVLYFSPDRFWYPYIDFTTTLIFDPIMGIFKISKVRYKGQTSSKRFNSFAKHLILCHNKRICSKMEDFLCIPPPTISW